MNTTCYVVGYIDPKTLKVVDAQLASESAQTITAFASQFPFDIDSVEDKDYDRASKKMLKSLEERKHWPRWGWVYDLVVKNRERTED